jgi:hypothetical protein
MLLLYAFVDQTERGLLILTNWLEDLVLGLVSPSICCNVY